MVDDDDTNSDVNDGNDGDDDDDDSRLVSEGIGGGKVAAGVVRVDALAGGGGGGGMGVDELASPTRYGSLLLYPYSALLYSTLLCSTLLYATLSMYLSIVSTYLSRLPSYPSK